MANEIFTIISIFYMPIKMYGKSINNIWLGVWLCMVFYKKRQIAWNFEYAHK
jgi:hypothetical protein